MPTIDNLRTTGLQGIQLKGDATTGRGSGCIDFPSVTSLPTTSGRYYLGVQGGSLVFVANGSATTVGAAGGGVASWDSLYDLDTSLTVDGTTLTFAGTHATNDVFTVTNATGTGDCIQITNSGTGYDIQGTSNTWNISKAGALLVKTIAHPTTDTAITIDANGTGKVQIAGTSTGNIELKSNITSDASKSLTMTGVGGSNIFVITAGDAVLSDGSLSITDADNASSVALTNNTITTADLIDVTSTSLTTGDAVQITVNGLTEGFMVKGTTTSAGLTTGGFLSYNDGSERFSVKADGATKIASGVNSTKALEITGIQTSENMVTLTSSGVTASGYGIVTINSSGASASGSGQIRIAPSGAPVEGSVGLQFVGASKVMQAINVDSDAVSNSPVLINGGGAIASGKGVLQVTADGTPASGGNVVDFRFTGTATNDPAILNLYGTTKDVKAIVADVDNTDVHAVGITGSGALSAGRMLYVANDGTPAANTDSIVELAFTGTATNNPRILTISGASKDAVGLNIDVDSATLDTVLINSGGAIADNKAVVHITADGTPAAAGSNLLRVEFTGTATNKPTVAEIIGTGKDCQGLAVTADPTTTSAAVISSAGALAADKATLEVISDAVSNADSAVVRIEQTNVAGVANVIHLKQDDISEPFIGFESTVGVGNAIEAVGAKSLTTTHFIKIDIEGVGAVYIPAGTIA